MEAGDKVEWLEAKTTAKGGINYTMRQGKLDHTAEDIAYVKRGSKLVVIKTSRLHVVGDGPNQLTQLMRAAGAR